MSVVFTWCTKSFPINDPGLVVVTKVITFITTATEKKTASVRGTVIGRESGRETETRRERRKGTEKGKERGKETVRERIVTSTRIGVEMIGKRSVATLSACVEDTTTRSLATNVTIAIANTMAESTIVIRPWTALVALMTETRTACGRGLVALLLLLLCGMCGEARAKSKEN